MSFFTDGLTFVAGNVAKGALGWVGGQAAGWVLGDLFGTNGPSTQDVLDAIGKLGTQLTNIQGTLATIEKQLTEEFAKIEQDLEEIHQEELYIAWQQVNNNIVTYKNQINTQYGIFIEYAATASVRKPTEQEIVDLVKQIQDSNVGAEDSLNGINSFVLGDGQAKGVLELWREMVTPLIAKGQMTFAAASTAYMNYYASILHAQIRAINLIVESYNQQNRNNISKDKYQHYQNLMTQQEVPFLRALEELTYDALQPGASFWTEVDFKDTTFASVEYFSLVQSLWAGGGWVASYAPTPWRLGANRCLPPPRRCNPANGASWSG
jgi:hypothetical protein